MNHDPQRISAEQIQEIIEDRGFDAEVLATDLPSPLIRPKSPYDYDESIDGTGPASAETTLAVEGMTCGACTSAIESAFKDVAGVQHFTVSLLSERAVVQHDPELLSPEKIAEMIEDRGFGATILETKERKQEKRKNVGIAQPSTATTTVAIEGMTCGACTAAVQGGFDGIEGLLQFNISLLAERAVITHDPIKLPSEKIAEIIEDRGFGAEILSTTFDVADHSGNASTAQFKIYGSMDAAAATAMEDKLKLLPGVQSAKLSRQLRA